GGGVIADAAPERARRRADAVAALERRAAPSPLARLVASLDAPRTAAEAGERSGLDAAERDAAVRDGLASGAIVQLADALVSREAFEAFATHVVRICEEARTGVGLAPKRFAALVARLAADGRIVDRGASLAIPGHVPRLDASQETAWARAREALARDPSHPPSPAELEDAYGLDREVIAALAERRELIRVGTEAVFLPDAVARFAGAVVSELEGARTITVSRARDLMGTSRKHVLPL